MFSDCKFFNSDWRTDGSECLIVQFLKKELGK